jgi:hypothetical protein
VKFGGNTLLDKDPELKKARGYTHPDSFVRNDGTEVLSGDDWDRRKKELGCRAKGRCEYRYFGGERCLNDGDDAHHMRPRWPKRIDNLDNLLLLCRLHHSLIDKRKIGGRS